MYNRQINQDYKITFFNFFNNYIFLKFYYIDFLDTVLDTLLNKRQFH